MEILLTPAEMEREGWAAFDAWEKLEKFRETKADSEERHQAYRAFCDAWLCRAQVRKVEEWAKFNNVAPLQAVRTRTYTAHLVLRKEAWQALRAAGGE